MLSKLLTMLAGFVIATISTLGYAGIALLMAIESACIPLPSEIIMPFSGYLVFRGEFVLSLVALSGAIGCVMGSLLAYWVGAKGGRPLVEKYGRYILVSQHDLALADRWFNRHGDGDSHSNWGLPNILLGGAGGYFKMGRYLQLPTTNPTQVLISIANSMGVDVPTFGEAPLAANKPLSALTG